MRGRRDFRTGDRRRWEHHRSGPAATATWNETKDVAVSFNVSLYPLANLRERLRYVGHRFATQSDTEFWFMLGRVGLDS